MANCVREDEDEFFWINQDPQPYLFEPEHTEEWQRVLEAEWARGEAEAVKQPGAKGESQNQHRSLL